MEFVFSTTVVLLIGSLLFYACDFDHELPKISFDNFLKWYNIAPYQWRVLYSFPNVVERVDVCKRYRFGFVGGIRLCLWKKRRDRSEKKRYDLLQMQELLNAVQKDIDRCRAQSRAEIKEASDIMNQVFKR